MSGYRVIGFDDKPNLHNHVITWWANWKSPRIASFNQGHPNMGQAIGLGGEWLWRLT